MSKSNSRELPRDSSLGVIEPFPAGLGIAYQAGWCDRAGSGSCHWIVVVSGNHRTGPQLVGALGNHVHALGFRGPPTDTPNPVAFRGCRKGVNISVEPMTKAIYSVYPELRAAVRGREGSLAFIRLDAREFATSASC